MNIGINAADQAPIYEQIVRQIKAHIIGGVLAEGEALPSMRLLAKELRISVITTKRAYEELEHEGFIYTQGGKGSFVAPQNKQLILEQNLKTIEQHLQQAISLAKLSGVSEQDLRETLQMLYTEEE